jgi:cell division protein FtsQ
VAAGLRVEDVLLEGRAHTTRAQVIAAIGLKRGDPILGFDPQTLRQRVEGLPWVRTARIERRFPSTVRIVITERNPIALWQKHGRFHIVDDEGAVIADSAPERYRDLLIVVGDGAPKHVPELVVLLAAEPALRKRVTAAVWVGERRWNLRFDDRTDVRLPEHEAPAAWAKLARLEREFGILGRDVDAIDMRIPDRLVVRSRGERGAGRPQGKST